MFKKTIQQISKDPEIFFLAATVGCISAVAGFVLGKKMVEESELAAPSKKFVWEDQDSNETSDQKKVYPYKYKAKTGEGRTEFVAAPSLINETVRTITTDANKN
jgi:hypothetical protein